MATNRDVKMTLSVDTLGEDGIKSLQKSIQTLASEGGDAAPEFQKLADEVGRLGEQSKALAAFKELGTVTEALTTKQAEATQTSANLSAKLDTLKTATQEAKAKQQEAAAALAAGQVATQEAAGALRLLKADYDNAGKQTEEFRTKQKGLIEAQTSAGIAIVALRTAQREANAELAAAEAAQKKAEGAYTRSEKAIASTTEALTRQEAVVKEAAAATEKLGLSATDVATSEGVLLAALNKVGSEAAQHSAAIKEMAESDRLLAIEEKGLAELFARGANALQAETLAQRDADRSNAEYAASLAKVNAEKARSVDTAAQWQREAEAIVNAAESAQKLERDTIALLKAEQQLASNNAFAQQLEDAKKLNQAADYVQFWTTELDRADEAAKQLQGAFNALNVRSAEAIQADIAAVRSALETVKAQAASTGQTMSGAFDAGKAKIAALELEMRQLNGTMTLGDKAAGVFSNSLGQISAGNIVADGVGYLVNKVKELTREFFTVNLESQRLTKALTQIYGSTAAASTQFDFLRDVTNKAGVSIRDVSDGFLRFSAATQTSGISLQASNAVFEQVTKAAGYLGLQGEQVTGVLEALGQMASKGTVSLEELRGQLGDRLPGALGIAAKGMQMTQADLIKLIESGNLATSVFFPAFERGLAQTFGDGTTRIEGFIQGWNRLINAIVETAQKASDSTMFTNMGKAFDFVATNINAVVTGIELLAVRFGILKAIDIASSFLGLGTAASRAAGEIAKKAAAIELDTAATNVNTAATNVNTAAKSQNAAQWAALGAGVLGTSSKLQTGTAAIETTTAATKAATVAKTGLTAAMGLMGGAATRLVGFLGGPIGALITFGIYAKDIGVWVGESAAKMVGWGTVLEKNEKQIAALAAAEKKAAEDRARQQAEQDVMNLKVAASAIAATKQAELAVTSAEKEVKAKEQKLKATQDLVNLQGVEEKGLASLVVASDAVATAARGELAAKEALVQKATEEIAAVRLTVGANGELTKAQQEQIAKLKEMLVARQAEVDKQAETIRQLDVETASRRVAAEAIKDNSTRVDELSAAYENAKVKLEVMRASGVASLAQLQAAEIDLAAALRIRNDAIDDSIAKSKLAQTQAQADIETTKSVIATRIAHNDLLKSEATLRGDVLAVAKLERDGKQLVIDQLKLEISARTSANAAALEQTASLRKEIDASTAAGQARLKELDAADQLTRAKQTLNLTGLDVVKGLEKELAASKNAADGMMSLVDAYKQLGVQSPQELAKVAAANATAWDTIKTDSNASIATLKSAFQTYADSAIAAVGGVGAAQTSVTQETLKLEAAAKGLSVTFDETGKAIVNAMGSGGAAIKSATGYMDVFTRAANEATAALEAQNAATEKGIAAQEKANDLKQRAIDLENKRKGVDADGFVVGSDGNRLSALVPDGRNVIDQATKAGLTEAEGYAIFKKMSNGNDIIERGGLYGSNAWGEVYKEINARKVANAKTAYEQTPEQLAIAESRSVSTIKPETASTAPMASTKTVTINININGRSQSVNVASDADATALTSVLRSLETAANTAS